VCVCVCVLVTDDWSRWLCHMLLWWFLSRALYSCLKSKVADTVTDFEESSAWSIIWQLPVWWHIMFGRGQQVRYQERPVSLEDWMRPLGLLCHVAEQDMRPPLTSHCLKQLISLTWALLLTYDTWYSLKSACLKRRLWLCGDVLVCSAKKAEMLVKALRQTLSDFCRDRSLKRLSFNEEQIHKFDKWVQSEGLVSVAVHRKHLVSVCSVSSASDDVKTWVCFCHDYSVPSVLSVRAAIAVRVTFLNFVAPRR